jgi:hypothetical protein
VLGDSDTRQQAEGNTMTTNDAQPPDESVNWTDEQWDAWCCGPIDIDDEPNDEDPAADFDCEREAEHAEWLESLAEAQLAAEVAEWEVGHPGEPMPDFPGFTIDDDDAPADDAPADEARHTSWFPTSMAALIAEAKQPPAEPVYLHRVEDKAHLALLYRGKLSSIAGQSETCKSWFAQLAAVQVLDTGAAVVYVDFEDDAASIVRRLIQLGASKRQLLTQLFVLHPSEASGWHSDSMSLARREFRLVLDHWDKLDEGLGLIVLDGVTSALSLDSLNPNDNAEVVGWYNDASQLARDYNAAVLLVDHTTKPNPNDRYAGGASQKLNAITGSQFKAELTGKPFSRNQPGLVHIKLTKDRPGSLRAHAVGGRGAVQHIADMHLDANFAENTVRVYLKVPSIEKTEDGDTKLTVLWGRIEKFLGDVGTPRTTTEIKSVRGEDKLIVAALMQMLAAGRVTETKQGQSRLYTLVDEPDIVVEP